MALALIAAAGSGERFHGHATSSRVPGRSRVTPKAFIELAGRPMVEWSVAALKAVGAIERIVVALPEGEKAPLGTLGVQGAATRSQSVRGALAIAGMGDPVIVHDAARPLVTPQLIELALVAFDQHPCDALVVTAPVVDTIKEVDGDGVVVQTLARGNLRVVQTPQIFRRAALEEALTTDDEVLRDASDDASLVERLGGRVRVLDVSPENIKITTPLDLQLAEQLLNLRKR